MASVALLLMRLLSGHIAHPLTFMRLPRKMRELDKIDGPTKSMGQHKAIELIIGLNETDFFCRRFYQDPSFLALNAPARSIFRVISPEKQ